MKFLFIFLSLVASQSFADPISYDFGKISGKTKNQMSAQDIRERLEVSGEIIVLDGTGHRVLRAHEERRQWQPNNKTGTIESNWSFKSEEHKPVALHHIWKVDDDGTMKVVIEQYENMERDGTENSKVEYGKLVKREEIIVTDFSPIVWPAVVTKDQRVVVRLVPSFRDSEQTLDLSALPMSAKNAVLRDSKGVVWLDHLSFTGKFVGLKTIRGHIYFSFTHFTGAQVMGWAQGNELSVNLGNNVTATVTSTTTFVPADVRAKVYAIYRADDKASSMNSTNITTTDMEEGFVR